MQPTWLNSRMRFVYRAIIFIVWCCFKFVYKIKVKGRENFPQGGAIIVANHTSFLDPPIVAVSCPEEIQFLARSSLFKGVFGKFIRALNSHPIDPKHNLDVMRKISSLVKEGKKVLIFPEGERSADGRLQPMQTGASFLMLRTKAPIIPIRIEGAYQIWHRNKKRPRLRGRLKVYIGKPIFFEEFASLDKKVAQSVIGQRVYEGILTASDM